MSSLVVSQQLQGVERLGEAGAHPALRSESGGGVDGVGTREVLDEVIDAASKDPA